MRQRCVVAPCAEKKETSVVNNGVILANVGFPVLSAMPKTGVARHLEGRLRLFFHWEE
jgi:hypothetical protein